MSTPNQFPKVCPCCKRAHDAESWAKLPAKPLYEDDYEVQEWRDCYCGSTIAIVLEVKRGECVDCDQDCPPDARLCDACDRAAAKLDEDIDSDKIDKMTA